MRVVALLVPVVLVYGCPPKHAFSPNVVDAYAVRERAWLNPECFETRHGVFVVPDRGAPCPPVDEFEDATQAMLDAVGLQDYAVAGTTVVVTPDWVECSSGRAVRGCSLMDGVPTAVVWLGDWRHVTRHELAHVARWRSTGDPDRAHQDVSFWWRASRDDYALLRWR